MLAPGQSIIEVQLIHHHLQINIHSLQEQWFSLINIILVGGGGVANRDNSSESRL